MNIEDSNSPAPDHGQPAGGGASGDGGTGSRRRSSSGRRGPRREDGDSALAGEGGRRSGGPGGRERGGRGSSGGERGRRGPGGGGRTERGGRTGRHEESGNRTPASVDTAASKTTKDKLSADSGSGLLAAVSRSFDLTIRLLPEPLREPITLGYLLARAQDTVADTPEVAAATRLEHLRALLEMVKYGPDAEILPPLQRDLAAKQAKEGERDLLQQLGPCLTRLEAQPTENRWELRRTLARIGRAQELDLLRFGDATGPEPKALADEAELDEYTYLIAGCVGELWTELCQRHLPAGWAKRDAKEMAALGKRFGQGLQMVNILRDLPEDLSDGRCYLPATLLAAHGLEPATLRENPAKVRPVLDALRRQAVEHLDAGWQYIQAIDSRKLRYAVALPVLIGLETLGLLAQTSPLETRERLKVSRASLRKLMASATVGAALPVWMSRLHAKLRKRAVGGK